jgi:hypothetical protein
MHVPINVKSTNNISKWQMGFNSAFKGVTVGEGNKKKKGIAGTISFRKLRKISPVLHRC